jgi:hypothetical protein
MRYRFELRLIQRLEDVAGDLAIVQDGLESNEVLRKEFYMDFHLEGIFYLDSRRQKIQHGDIESGKIWQKWLKRKIF